MGNQKRRDRDFTSMGESAEIERSRFHDWLSENEKNVSKILRQVMKLQENELGTHHAVRINIILRHVKNLQKDVSEDLKVFKKLEALKKLEEQKKLETMKKLEKKKEIEETMRNIDMMVRDMIIRHLCSGDAKLTYYRDYTLCFPPEEMQKLEGYVKMAIDVFNQRQPIKYTVVDIDIATTRSVDGGSIVLLFFTAKHDDVEKGIDFEANIHCGTQLTKVTDVEYS